MKSKLLILATIFAIASSCASNKKDYLITIHTAFGDMKVILYDETPLHKANFIELAESGQYDSTIWLRIIKGFMIQGGGFDIKNGSQSDKTIPAEFVEGMMHHKGALAAARQGDNVNPDKASSWCQFYIVQGKKYSLEELVEYEDTMNENNKRKLFQTTIMKPENADLLSAGRECQREWQRTSDPKEKIKYQMQLDSITDQVMQIVDKDYSEVQLTEAQKEVYTSQGGSPHLDNAYTVFGRVVEGLEVIDQLAVVQTDRDKPTTDFYMTMEVERIPKKQITDLYAYEYSEK